MGEAVKGGDLDSKTAAALIREGSEIEELGGRIGPAFCVWTTQAPAVQKSPDLLFALCQVMPGSTPKILKLKQVKPEADDTVFEVPVKRCFNANVEVDPLQYGDIGSLPHGNAACVLDFLHARYMRGVIYSTAEPLIVAVNPFEDVGCGSAERLAEYRDAVDVEKLPPHAFYTSRRALTDLHALHKSQTIIVSGESGAGKTETTKLLMKYVASSRSGSLEMKIQSALMAANPVLEAFGNAKTVRNNNSSRFGRFMQLDVAREGGILHGAVEVFLLEKSRIVQQAEKERSYHIFYQLLKGAPPFMRQRYMLLPIEEYAFLNPQCYDAPGIDDEEEFEQVVKSFESMDLSEAETCTIWSLVSGILLLGNAKPTAKKEAGVERAASYAGRAEETLRSACSLLFLDFPKILHELTVKTTYAGSNKIEGRWDVENSEMLRSSLAKALYEKMFLWIVQKLNSTIELKGGIPIFLGLLDIFGFEVFQRNSLEQLFINITNEMLQRNFTDIVFRREAELYQREGLQAKEISYTTNDALVDLLIGKGLSVLGSLEDQCINPTGDDDKFVASLNTKLKEKPGFIASKMSKSLDFTIHHTIGNITYNASQFCFKNRDVLRPEIVEIVQGSNNELVRSLFEGVKLERGKIAKGQLIGSQFLSQLNKLMSLIRSTEPHFIRCIKPNEEKQPKRWTNSKVLIQLHALSVLEALQLRQLAFSYRRTFEAFVDQFKFLDLSVAGKSQKPAKELCEQLLASARVSAGDFAIGHTMIFLKPQAAKLLVRMQREALASWAPLVATIEAILCFRKLSQQAIAERNLPATRICAHVRRKLVIAQAAKATA